MGFSNREETMNCLALTMVWLLALILAIPAFAHPPKTVTAEFDLEEHVLKVEAKHDTKDANKHFIKRIEVELNGEKIIEQKFGSQEDRASQRSLYRIAEAEVGDTIKATAVCNVAGKKSESLKIVKKEKPKATEGKQTE
jgi:hypothetical protein